MSEPPEPIARPIDPRHRRLIALATIVAIGTSVVGSALAPYLLTHHPVLLLALAPEPRHVVLTTPLVPAAILIPLSVGRRVAGLIALYFFGWAYGETAIQAIERHFGGMGRLLRWVQKNLTRFGALLVLVFPMPSVCVLAGIANASPLRTLLALVVGQCFWVSATWAFGDLVSELTRPLLAFLAEHVLEATAICVAVVVVWQLWTHLRRRARRATKPPS